MGCGADTKDILLEDQNGCFRRCEEFKYLGVKIDKEDKQKNDIKNRINKGRTITPMLNSVLWNKQITRKNKLRLGLPKGLFPVGLPVKIKHRYSVHK